ncbi:uncharacterized protein MYCFIDRAFT_179360 [Pseudocercospora fijiensis CIRAD86]|uniref:Uncharacterized protein n=1 Tax=Pseudocercospora fijiensis (strain CIRAD86) TaxID=383855 RepID=M2YJH9_PSEFD|nr:uncharacterized protein MYCFIDRAFT_179360 [Pseudocercospora fijiensis CIRAD86]EME77895.1 hypothetical protein MYCFIDRAFT_179360 [Pseudocercospora fijiensis CIRAD86]
MHYRDSGRGRGIRQPVKEAAWSLEFSLHDPAFPLADRGRASERNMSKQSGSLDATRVRGMPKHRAHSVEFECAAVRCRAEVVRTGTGTAAQSAVKSAFGRGHGDGDGDGDAERWESQNLLGVECEVVNIIACACSTTGNSDVEAFYIRLPSSTSIREKQFLDMWKDYTYSMTGSIRIIGAHRKHSNHTMAGRRRIASAQRMRHRRTMFTQESLLRVFTAKDESTLRWISGLNSADLISHSH